VSQLQSIVTVSADVQNVRVRLCDSVDRAQCGWLAKSRQWRILVFVWDLANRDGMGKIQSDLSEWYEQESRRNGLPAACLLVNVRVLPDWEATLSLAREFCRKKDLPSFPILGDSGASPRWAVESIVRQALKFETSDWRVIECLIVVDRGVGKTSLISRIFDAPLGIQYVPTRNSSERYEFVSFGGHSAILQTREISEVDSLESLWKTKYRPGVVIVVHDLTNAESFGHLQRWTQQIRRFSEVTGTECGIFIVGNKSDETGRSDPTGHLMRGRVKPRLLFFDLSARTGDGVNGLLEAISLSVRSKQPCNVQ
jgi:GTPase SAR1 family protein